MGLKLRGTECNSRKVHSVTQTCTSYPTAAQTAAYHDPVSAALSVYDKLRKKGTELVHENA